MMTTKTPATESRLALTRWYAGTGRAQSPRWYRAVCGRLAVARRSAPAIDRPELDRAIELATQCVRMAEGRQ